MLPAFGLFAMGPGRWWIPLPLPLVLFWPVIGLALGVVALVDKVRGGARGTGSLARARVVLLALCQLHGLKVDVRTATGMRVLVWLF